MLASDESRTYYSYAGHGWPLGVGKLSKFRDIDESEARRCPELEAPPA